MIHHLSYPKGGSVNDFIPVDFSAVQYTQVKDAIAGIKRFKAPCCLATCDIKMAHINLPLAPKDYHLFGFKWKQLYYYDKCLAMRCSSSCQIFERFSTALEWIAQRHRSKGSIFHILDDFLIIAQTEKD